MKFLNLWPLFLLLLIPVIILMYLLKQKAPELPVPSVFLWKELYNNRESDTPWEKLKKNILLILQLITVVVLVFTLMDPYINAETKSEGAVALLIDNSASMGMTVGSKETRLDRAKASAVSLVESLTQGTSVTVIECNKDATVLISGSLDRNAVISKIRSISETCCPGDIGKGVSLCDTMKQAVPELTISAFTDTYVPLGNTGGTIYDLSTDADNASVNYVSQGKSGGRTVCLASVSNHSASEISSDLSLYGDDILLSVKEVTLAPKETKVIYFEDIDFTGEVIKAELSREDDLSHDNVCYSLSEEVKTAKVLMVSERNLYLEKAIRLNNGVELVKTDEIDELENFEKEGFDLFIFDGIIPEKLPEQGSLFFINTAYDELFSAVSTLSGKYVNIEKTEYTGDIADASFGVSELYAFDCPFWATSVLSVKDGNSTYSAGFIGEYEGRRICVLGFDIHSSDLPLKMEFPILIYSLVSRLTDTSAVSDDTVLCGDTVRITVPSGNSLKITFPKGESRKYPTSSLNFSETKEPGIYTLSADAKEELFAVNFPTSESFTERASELSDTSDTAIIDVTERGIKSFRPLLSVLLILLLLTEWVIYLRK